MGDYVKALKCASALLLLALGGQARASSFVWCQMSGGNYENYLSGIVEIDEGRDAYRAFLAGPFGKAFRDHVRGAFDPKATNLNCTREDSLFYANDQIEVMINANPGIKFVQTGWRGGKAAAVKADRPKATAKAAEPEAAETVAAAPATAAGPAKKPWDIEYERKLAAYEEQLAKQKQAVAAYERGKAETAAAKAELRTKAEKAKAEWQAAVAACRAGDRSACAGGGTGQ